MLGCCNLQSGLGVWVEWMKRQTYAHTYKTFSRLQDRTNLAYTPWTGPGFSVRRIALVPRLTLRRTYTWCKSYFKIACQNRFWDGCQPLLCRIKRCDVWPTKLPSISRQNYGSAGYSTCCTSFDRLHDQMTWHIPVARYIQASLAGLQEHISFLLMDIRIISGHYIMIHDDCICIQVHTFPRLVQSSLSAGILAASQRRLGQICFCLNLNICPGRPGQPDLILSQPTGPGHLYPSFWPDSKFKSVKWLS